MDSQNKYLTDLSDFLRHEIHQEHIKFGYYQSRGRVAVIAQNTALLNALKQDPDQSPDSQTLFLVMSWLMGKPRQPASRTTHYLLSSISPDKFSGSTIHPNHNLFVDTFDSPYQWQEGETRAAEQLADALLPSGQWHRHYDIVVLSSKATEQQVSLIQHWMLLTGGSVLIYQEEETSSAIKKLLDTIIPPHDRHIRPSSTQIASNQPTQTGIAVYSQKKTEPQANRQPTHIMTLPHLQNLTSPLPHQQIDTVWIYDAKIIIPKAGKYTFALDTSRIEQDIQLEIGTQKITVTKGEQTPTLTFNHLKEGERCAMRITTTTDGRPPEFRLGWAPPNTDTLALIPQDAFVHEPILQNSAPIKKAPRYRDEMPLADVMRMAPSIHGVQQVISLPSTAINQLALTDERLREIEYFSVTLKKGSQQQILKLDDIALASHASWQTLAKDIEHKINQRLAPLAAPITVDYRDHTLTLKGNGLTFTQFQLKKSQQIPYVEILKNVTTVQAPQSVTHSIHFTLDQLNSLTHITLSLTGKHGRQINLIRRAFKSANVQFASPEEFAGYLQRVLRHYSQDTSLQVVWDDKDERLKVIDHVNRALKALSFGYQEQKHPLIIAENTTELPNHLTVGAITGKLPQHANISHYQQLEGAKSGSIRLNSHTGEWFYLPNRRSPFTGHDQFDFVAIFKGGWRSAPLSIQIQTEKAPILSRPGIRTFSVLDPIYNPPAARNYAVPEDMQVHGITLTQTHQQHPDSPYLSLIAHRWALVKVDITSRTAANAPDIVAIVSDQQGNELGRVRLMGPRQLPQQLADMPVAPSVSHKIADQLSYSAPLKGAWIKPDIRIRLIADNQPITLPYTDSDGYFSPKVTEVPPLTARVASHHLYQTGEGLYAYSPLSWGKEAVAKLPVSQLTLHSSPSHTLAPVLSGYIHPNFYASTLTMPQYDKRNPFFDPANLQIAWAYQQSDWIKKANGTHHELYYTAIQPSIYGSLLGMASPLFGGGIAQSDVLWHEIFGHGLGLSHTNHPYYPFSKQSNGPEIAYDQARSAYITYRYTHPENGSTQEIRPAMYPTAGEDNKAPYDAFIPHSSHYNQKIQRFLSRPIPTSNRQQNHPVYWVSGSIVTLPDGNNHPYSHLNIQRTLGDLPIVAQRDKLRDIPHVYLLVATYATQNGLMTTDSCPIEDIKSISLNMADHGELVKIQIMKADNQQPIYTYANPDALANRLFHQYQANQPLQYITLDNYWCGSPLFWSATDPHLIDFSTGRVNNQRITPNSALCATWISDGQRHQQYFSLSDPWGKNGQINTKQPFLPINHLTLQADRRTTPLAHYNIEANAPLLADVYINQTVDITTLQLPKEQQHYWVTLLVEDPSGDIREQTPLAPWQITRQGELLSIIGTTDSTPNLKITAIRIYLDKHLQDDTPPSTVTLTRNHTATITENTRFLDYNQPVIFNHIEQQPELIAMMEKTANQTMAINEGRLPSTPRVISAPLTV